MKVQNEMATRIAIDTVGAVGSLRGLSNALSASISSWKAQEAASKSTGDSLGAAKAKFEGLNSTIDIQKRKIEELKSRQADLDVENKKDAETYLKLQKDIESATKQLSSYESQQNKAKQSLDYYSNGLADLQKGYRNSNALSQSFVSRLQAEGNEIEANKAKLGGLKQGLANLSEQYKIQESDLKRIASESGSTSDAYKRQQVRLNETATAMAKTKGEARELEVQMNKKPKTWFSKAKDSLVKLNKEAKHTSKLGETIKGVFAGTFLANGVSSLTNSLKEAAKEGLELAESGEQTSRVWHAMGLNDEQIKKMGTQMSDLRKKTGYAGGALIDMQKTFMGLTGSADKTQELTRGITAIGISANLSGEETAGLAKQFTKVQANGKLSSGILGRMEKSAHGVTAELANAAGVSQSTFEKMVSGGEVTSSQFQDLVTKIGQGNKAFDSFGKTGKGAIAQMKGTWASLKATMMKPLVEVKGSGLESLNKVLQSKEMQSMAEKLGKSIGNIAEKMASLMGYIASHQKDLSSLVGSLGSILGIIGKTIWKVFSGTISTIAKMFGDLGDKSKKAKDPLGKLSSAFDSLSKHKKAIEELTKVFLGLLVTKKVVMFASSIASLGKSFSFSKNVKDAGGGIRGFMSLLKPSPVTIWVAAVAAIGFAFYEAYKHIKPFRDIVNKLLSSIKDFSNKVYKKYLKPAIDNTNKAFDSWGKNLKSFWSKNGKPLEKAIGSFVTVMKVVNIGVTASLGAIWGAFKSVFAGIERQVKISFDTIKGVFSGSFKVLKGLTEIFIGVFTGNWGKAKDGAIDAMKGMGGIIGSLLNGFVKTFGNIAKTVGEAVVNGIIGGINAGIGAIDGVIHMFGGSKDAIGKIKPVKFARGTGPLSRDTLSMLNDGNDSPETNNREIAFLPDGKAFMPKKKNWVGILPAGTEIANAKESRMLLQSGLVTPFAKGTGLLDKIKDFGAKALEDIEDKVEAITNAIAHPIKFLSGIWDKAVSFKGTKEVISIGNALGNGFIKNIVSPFTNLFKSLKKKQEDSQSAPTGSGVQRWKSQVIKALKANGLSTSSAMVNKVLRQINTESGGNEKAMGGTDGLADGRAMGLMQVKPGTFNANRFPGHNNIMNGYDSLLAGLNYAKKRYGSDLSFLGKGHGYANGGLINTHGLYEISEDNKQEMVIPLDITKRTRANQLLGEVVSQFSNDSSQGNTIINQADTTEAIAKLGAKFDTLLAMFGQLLGLNGAQLQAIKESGFDKDKQYKQQALDQAMRDVQAY